MQTRDFYHGLDPVYLVHNWSGHLLLLPWWYYDSAVAMTIPWLRSQMSSAMSKPFCLELQSDLPLPSVIRQNGEEREKHCRILRRTWTLPLRLLRFIRYKLFSWFVSFKAAWCLSRFNGGICYLVPWRGGQLSRKTTFVCDRVHWIFDVPRDDVTVIYCNLGILVYTSTVPNDSLAILIGNGFSN